MRHHLKRAYRLALYTVVALLVGLAAASTGVRLLLHNVDSFRERLEAWAGDAVGQPVRIGGVSAGLKGLVAGLGLNEVELLDPQGSAVVARFARARLRLDLVRSLRRGTPVLDHLEVHGASLVVERLQDGSLRVRGLVREPDPEASPASLGAWLLAQQRLVLRDSRLIWRDFGAPPLAFDGAQLEWSNRGDRHRLVGSIRPPSSAAEPLRVALEIDGDPFGSAGWQGRAWLKGMHLQPQRWLPLPASLPLSPRAGDWDLELWAAWHDGRLVRADGAFAGRAVRAAGGDGELALDHVSAKLNWLATEQGWGLRLADVRVAHQGHDWSPLRIQVERVAGRLRLALSAMDLAAAAAIAERLPVGADEQRRSLAALQPRGTLRDVLLVRPDAGPWHLQAELDGVTWRAWQSLPGVSGIDGTLRVGPDGAAVHLDGRAVAFDAPRLFRAPLLLDRIGGSVAVRRNGSAWRLSANRLELANADLRAEVGLALHGEPGTTPFLDLRVRFADGRARAVPTYLPAAIMPPATVAWLDRAFHAGRAAAGYVLFHGRLDRFPFRHGDGRFEIRFRAEDVELDYRPGWPRLREVDGEVLFDGPGMIIDSRSGRVLDGRIEVARVAITRFAHPVLTVDGELRLPGRDLLTLLRTGELGERMPDLSTLEAGGGARVDLELRVPLVTRLAESEPLRVAGSVHLEDAWLRLARGPTLTGAVGTVHFDGPHLRGDDVLVQAFGAPASLDIFERERGGAMQTVVAASGRADGSALARELDLDPLRHLRGESDWQAALAFRGDEVRLDVRSSLRGMAVQLPAPLHKPAADEEPFALHLDLAGPEAGRVELEWGQRLRAALRLGGDEALLERAALHFGWRTVQLPERAEVSVTGALDALPLAEWGRLLGTSGADGGRPLSRAPMRIVLDRLYLVEGGGELPAGTGDGLLRLPPLEFRAADLRHGDMRLGAVSLRLQPRSDGLLLQRLRAESDAFTVTGDGRWRRGGRSDATRVDLKLEAADVGTMMRALGFANVINEGRLTASGNLVWPGSPAAMRPALLSGRVAARIDDGLIDEVDPGTGRLLGLFSLQALPKRLALDFRDLLRKGWRFDRIEGNFRVDAGNAFTDDLRLTSPAAATLLEGRTGLAAEDYDLTLTVVPNLSDGLAVAGGLALGPQVGAALLLLQKLLKLPLDEASASRYRVTGSWDDPVVERVARAATADD